MITILKGTSVEVHWRIIRTENKITEDFTGAELRVFLVGPDNVYPLEYGIVKVEGYNEIRFAVSSKGLSTGVYDLKAVWVKNKHSIPDVVNNQFMSVSRRGGLLAVTDAPSEVTFLDKTIKLMSYVESYGRDGMSAYELAAFRGVLPEGMSEAEWANQENVRQQNEEQRKAAEDARREAEGEREAHERLREQGEADRVSAEAAREAAEGVREVTFQTNEAAREAEFGKAIQAAKDNLVVVNDLTTGGADKALSAEMGKELERGIVLSVAKATSANYFTNSSLDSNGLMSYENGLCVSEKIALHRDYSGERIKVVHGNVPTTHKILVEYADGIAIDSTTANGDFYRECLINNNVREIQIVFEEGYEAKVFDGANNLIWKASTKVENLEEKIETELNGADNFVEGRYLDENGALQLSESLSVSEIINIDSSLQGKKLVVDYGEFEFNTKVKICVEYAQGNKVDINAQTQGSTTRAVTINSGVDSIRITFAKGHKASVFIQDTGEVIWQAGKTNGLVDKVINIADELSRIDAKLPSIEKNILSFDNGWRTSKIVNPRVDMKKKNLKILEIGNSFTNYPTAYISYIVDNAKSRGTLKRDELDVAFYRLTRTGSSFHDWYKLYHNQDTPLGTTYLFSKAKDELGVINATDETCDVTSNALMIKVLTEYKWDIILIHQRSVYSGECDLWEGHTDAGYLKEFIMILKKYQPQAAIGTTLVHSPSKKINAYKEESTYERWKNIARGVAKMQAEYGVDIVIPWGTALECLRQSSLNDAESELTSDLQHPQYGLVVYTLGLVYFECIYGTRYGVSLLDDTWSRDMSPERATATYPSSMYDINDSTRPIAKAAAMLACCDMYSVVNPEDYLDYFVA